MYPYSCLFQLHGMMRVILEPLIGDVPIVGAVTMFFIRRPVGTWDHPSLSSTPTISLSISPFLSPFPPNTTIVHSRLFVHASICLRTSLSLCIECPEPQHLLLCFSLIPSPLSCRNWTSTGLD